MRSIRLARFEDLDTVVSLYDAARQRMAEGGNPTQWVNGYPERTLLEADIAVGQLYVLTRGAHICGVFVLATGEDPTYDRIEGAWLNAAPYGTIHRIASDGVTRGVLQEAVDFAFTVRDNVRIDTHRNNAPMQHLVRKLGFTLCGIINQPDGTPRDAFQKTKQG